MPNIYFTPGPSQLYFTVPEHLRAALREEVASISHRSKGFESIYQFTEARLRELLEIPEDYYLLFTSSATEVWERIMMNLVGNESYHFINGAFSARFCTIARQLGKNPYETTVEEGKVVDIESVLIPESTELIALTHNETSTGAMQPVQDIARIRKSFPNQLIALDVVSSAPDAQINYRDVDTAYFSVQKCFGLPAGLGVWILNERCIEKYSKLVEFGQVTGSYHDLNALLDKAKKHQTPETPNVLGIYLLGKVAADMLEKGLEQIRREISYKSALLYHTFEQNAFMTPFVEDPQHRSRTTTVANVESGSSALIEHLASKGMVVGSGYGKYGDAHIRIANFPTHSKEQIELLADYLSGWNG